MADVSVLKLNGTSYDITDKFARKGKKNIIFIGDSYGNHPDTTTNNYVSLITSWFSDQIGVSYRNTVSGSAFNQKDTSSGYISFKTCLENLSSSVTNKKAITDIVVCGGMNDCPAVHGGSDYNGILTAISTFVSYCHTNYPNAIVRIGFIAYSSDLTCADQLRNVYAMYKRCNECGAVYLNGVENAFYTTHMNADIYHPTAEGAKAIALAVGNAIFTGFGNVTDGMTYKFCTITNSSTVQEFVLGDTTWNKSNFAIAVSRNNNILHFRIAYRLYYDFIRLVNNSSISGWGKTSFTAGTIDAGPIFNTSGYTNIMTTCYLKNGTSTVAITTAEISITGKTLQIKVHGNGNSITFNGIEFFPTTISFDTKQIL